MAVITVPDNCFDPVLLDLVKSVFERNHIEHDPTDYVPIRVSTAFKIPGLVRDNSILHLAPLTSNMRKPNLKLNYNRANIADVLEPLTPQLYNADMTLPAHQMIDQINLSLNGQVVLRKEDFYDTYVGQGEDHTYVTLFAKPESFLYYGDYQVPVIDSEVFVLTFSIQPVIEPEPEGE